MASKSEFLSHVVCFCSYALCSHCIVTAGYIVGWSQIRKQSYELEVQ